MVTSLADFEEDTAFERSVLDVAFPVLGPCDSLDLRGPNPHVTLTAWICDSETARRELVHQLRPLFFGAARKMLDLLLELDFLGSSPKSVG